ncbi:MAG: TIGR01212 family radical SAM protein [Spirochaetaceae bacterium]|nr:TIGR01212 family radical SAM protein [Spirochaetaceae bacterium]
MGTEIFWASKYYKKIFGEKVYKISLDAGCTCPNRDGTKGTGGCIFCSPLGSGEFAISSSFSIDEQIEKAKKLLQSKFKGKKYIAYFQNFTNTYGNQKKLIDLFFQTASKNEIVGISIATRPDCIQEEMFLALKELSNKTHVTLEFGLQTSNENTAKFINRCYKNQEYSSLLKKIQKDAPKIHVVTHCIFGLPHETTEDMLNTVNFCINAGTNGIKITLLYVLENTKLATLYQQDRFKCLEMTEYFDLLAQAIPLIPKNIVIHRLTGDGPKKLLIAPLWTSNKKKVHNSLMAFLNKNNISQKNT